MGMDPLTIGVIGSAAGSLWGAANQGQAQNRALGQQQSRYNDLYRLVQGQMQTGENPYARAISQFAQGLGSPQASTYQATSATAPPGINGFDILGGAGFNAGQDSMMQMLRKGPGSYAQDPTLRAQLQNQAGGNTAFNNSQLFAALEPMDTRLINQQVGALRAQAGSLGQLGGTAMANAEGQLRTDLVNNIMARNAGIQQQSYESAQQRAMQALGLQTGQEQAQNQYGLGAYGAQAGALGTYLQSALGAAGIAMQPALQGQQIAGQYGLANAGAQNQAGQFNAGQQNQYGMSMNDLILRAMLGAGGLQGQQQSQNAGLLGILGGMQQPGVGTSPWPGALGDMSQMAMLYPFLRGMMPQGMPPDVGTVPQVPIPAIPQAGMMMQLPNYGWRGF